MDREQFRAYTRWNHAANRRRYDAAADPWRLLPVDPTGVDEYTSALRLDAPLDHPDLADVRS